MGEKPSVFKRLMGGNKKSSFLSGAFILAVAGLLCKVIGAVYKIPLRNLIGEEAMGVYSAVYPIYTFLLVFSTSGIPTAISKLVAEERSKGNAGGAHRVFVSSLKLLLGIGAVTTLLMLLGSSALSSILRIESWQPVAAISFSLLFVSLLSAYRGYFQGMQNMVPTAVTQVVEQIIKLAAGFFFAIRWYRADWGDIPSYVMGAAGALLGITLSELAAFLLIFFLYQKNKDQLLTESERNEAPAYHAAKRLLQIAIPMTIGGAIKPLVDAIDSLMIKSMMESYFGYNMEYIDALYGFLKSDCGTLINMPSVLTVALSMALVPAVSDALAGANGKREVKRITRTGLKLSMIIGLPCAIGFLTMAKEILSLLYVYMDKDYSGIFFSGADKLTTTSHFLMILAFGVLFLSVIQTAAGILQGIGKVTQPVVNLFIGMVIKVILNFALVPSTTFGMTGVPIGTVICYAVAAILDVMCVINFTHVELSFKENLLRPLGASAMMTAAILLLKLPFRSLLAVPGSKAKLVTVLIIGVAAVVYFIGLIVFSVFDESDIALMPGGKKIEKLLNKLGAKVRPMEK